MEKRIKNSTIDIINYRVLTATIFIGFLIFGFSENIKGPAIPKLQTEFT
ncbi:MAG: hypothetical protein K0S75_2528, partial [Clostridia bacterium]|nr:hypothetical protein [Clostridia bacterium]